MFLTGSGSAHGRPPLPGTGKACHCFRDACGSAQSLFFSSLMISGFPLSGTRVKMSVVSSAWVYRTLFLNRFIIYLALHSPRLPFLSIQSLEPSSSSAGTASFTLASSYCTKMKANLAEVAAS